MGGIAKNITLLESLLPPKPKLENQSYIDSLINEHRAQLNEAVGSSPSVIHPLNLQLLEIVLVMIRLLYQT